MKTIATQTTATNNRYESPAGNAVVDYYTEAGPDYAVWSKNFNMHFGYAAQRWDCWSREKMLQRMNAKVLESLQLESGMEVVDMGCGVGATVRYGAINYPEVQFTGYTITGWQIKKAEGLITPDNLSNAHVRYGDYNRLPIEENTIDGVYGLESICHAEGTHKAGPLREAYRILKQGGRFTMVDGFLKKEESALSKLQFSMYKTVCDNWALPSFPNIHHVVQELKSIGFQEIAVQEISWKIAPSAVHAPFLSVWFFLKSMFKGERLGRQSWRNLKACFTIFFLGLCRTSIGYYTITAKK